MTCDENPFPIFLQRSWALLCKPGYCCTMCSQSIILLHHCITSSSYIPAEKICNKVNKNLCWKPLSVILVLATGGGAAACQGGSAKPPGQLLWSRPPASHAGHFRAGRVQPHGPTTLSGQPAQTRQRGTQQTHAHGHRLVNNDSPISVIWLLTACWLLLSCRRNLNRLAAEPTRRTVTPGRRAQVRPCPPQDLSSSTTSQHWPLNQDCAVPLTHATLQRCEAGALRDSSTETPCCSCIVSRDGSLAQQPGPGLGRLH